MGRLEPPGPDSGWVMIAGVQSGVGVKWFRGQEGGFVGAPNCSTGDVLLHFFLAFVSFQETLPLVILFFLCLGLNVGEFIFLIGTRECACVCACLWNLKSVFNDKKRGIPHWCSYSSKQQYLSASIAGFLWCDKSIVCCVELQDFHPSLFKNALLRKTEFAHALFCCCFFSPQHVRVQPVLRQTHTDAIGDDIVQRKI